MYKSGALPSPSAREGSEVPWPPSREGQKVGRRGNGKWRENEEEGKRPTRFMAKDKPKAAPRTLTCLVASARPISIARAPLARPLLLSGRSTRSLSSPDAPSTTTSDRARLYCAHKRQPRRSESRWTSKKKTEKRERGPSMPGGSSRSCKLQQLLRHRTSEVPSRVTRR